MRKILSLCVVGIVLHCNVQATTQVENAQQEESFHVRRIVELWRSQEYDLAKDQLRAFESMYPSSRYRDSLLLMVADYERQKGRYGEALRIYGLVRDAALQQRLLDQRLECLYHLERWADISVALAGHLPSNEQMNLGKSDSLRLFFAAEAARHVGNKKRALTIYERLLSTSMAEQAQLAAARLYSEEGQFTRAAQHYQDLAVRLPERRQALLFKAAECLAVADPEGAVALLDRMRESEGLQASFTEVLLLFRTGRHTELVEKHASLRASLSKAEQVNLDLFVGRSLNALGRHGEVIALLEPLVNRIQDNEKRRVACLTLASSARREGQVQKIATLRQMLHKASPDDSALPRLLHLQAATALEREQWDSAAALLSELTEHYPHYEHTEEVLLEHAQTLARLQKWEEAHQIVSQCIQNYPNSEHSVAAKETLRRILVRELQEKSSLSAPAQIERQRRLANELYSLIDDQAQQSEEAISRFYLAKAAFAQKRYVEAQKELELLLERYPEGEPVSQAQLLLAYCHYESSTDLPLFVRHAEEALRLKPDLPQADAVRTNLFGAYLQLTQRSNISEQAAHKERAAQHLWWLLEKGKVPIKEDNLRWFFEYQVTMVDQGIYALQPDSLTDPAQKERARQALTVLDKIKKSPHKEDKGRRLLQQATLHAWLGETEAQYSDLQQLRKLADEQEESIHCQRGLFQLAKLEEQTGRLEQSLSLYQHLSAKASLQAGVREAAALQCSRLRLQQLPPEERKSSSPVISQIETDLQGLQTRRVLEEEPVHLEAAWDLAHLRAGPLIDEQNHGALLKELKAAKRKFSMRASIADQDYHTARLQQPDKDRIYQAYLMLYDARIAQSEAWIAAHHGLRSEQRSKQQAAKRLYETLLKSDFAVSNYLVVQAQSGLKEIDSMRRQQL